MSWKTVVAPITLINAETAAKTGTEHRAPAGRVYSGIRYYIKSSGSTTATVDIQGSYDGTNWANLITQVSNPGTAVTTGLITGPVTRIRAVTAGATHGTITVKAEAILEP